MPRKGDSMAAAWARSAATFAAWVERGGKPATVADLALLDGDASTNGKEMMRYRVSTWLARGYVERVNGSQTYQPLRKALPPWDVVNARRVARIGNAMRRNAIVRSGADVKDADAQLDAAPWLRV